MIGNDYISAHRVLLNERQEKALFHQWQNTKNPRLLDKIVRCYSPIVWKCAKRFSGYQVDAQELISEGGLALVESAHRFEIDKGFRFATFARTWVEGLMLAYITKNYFMVNVCSNQRMKKLFFCLRRMVTKEIKNTSELHPLFFQKVAEQLDVSKEEVIVMYNLFKKPYDSLSEPISGEDSEEFTRESMLPCPEHGPEDLLGDIELANFHKTILTEVIERVLTPREKRIFEAQLLSNEDDFKTLQELANQLDLSKERVRQVRNMAYKKVKSEIILDMKPRDKESLFMESNLR